MNEPLRILHLALIRFWSAIAWHTVTLAGALRDRGHEVGVVGAAGSPLLGRAVEAGLTLPGAEPFPYVRPWNWAGTVGQVRRLLRTQRCDVVFVHTGSGHFEAHLARTRFPTAIVRIRADARRPRGHPGNKWLHRSGAERVAVSGAYMQEDHLGGWDLPPGQVIHLPPGIDVDHIAGHPGHDRAAARRELGERYRLPAGEPWIGIIGRLSPVKGHEVLLEAMTLVRRKREQFRLFVVGGEAEVSTDSLRQLARYLGIEQRVVFTGLVDDPLKHAAALDVGVVSSLGSEAVSRSALEFMAVGVPVVATRVGILPEVVDDEAHLVVPGDPGALARSIAGLLADPERATRLGLAGQQRARKRYNLGPLAERAEQVAREAIRVRRESRERWGEPWSG